MIAVLIIFTLVIAIVGSWLYLIKDCKDVKLPGPRPFPIIGNGHLFLGRPMQFLIVLNNLKNWYGDAVRVHLLHKRYLIFYHPKYIEPLMSRSDLITKGRSYDFLRPWLGDGLLTSTGNKWKTQRKFLTPAFHFNILQNYLPVFLKNEKILVKTLMGVSGGPPVDLFPIIALNALDNVTEAIMGVSVNAQSNSESEYIKSIQALSRIIATRIRNPFIGEDAIFYLSSYKKIQEDALNILHGQTTDVINKRRQELDSLNVTKLDEQSEMGIRNKYAFLDLLLLSEVDGQKISDEQIREQVDTFMFEGHDTTTSGICFALYLLSKHPDAQEKILEEQKRILGDDLDRDPTTSDLQQMKYLELVIKESLRIYPSVPLIERMVTKDTGQKFAMMEMKTTLAGVVKHFKLLPSNEELELCADLILRSENDVKVQFKAR